MKYVIKIFYLFCTVLFIYSCTARVDIKTDDAQQRLSVFGYITNDTTRHYVKIAYTSGYFSSEAPQGISNAIVEISDGNSVFTLQESMKEPGTYLTKRNVYGIEGKTYTLDIKLDYNDDGIMEHYQAKSTMPYGTRVDSITLQPSIMPTLPNLLLYGEIPQNQKNNLGVYLIKNNEQKSILNYFMILPDWYFMGHDIDGYEFPCLVEDGVELGDTITFKVNSFNEEFSSFLSHAKSETGGKNPIFSGPATDVETNIVAMDPENEIKIVGFFSAFPTSEKSTISNRDYTNQQK